MKKLLLICVLAIAGLNIAAADDFFVNIGNKTQDVVDDMADVTVDTARNVKRSSKKVVKVAGDTVKEGAKNTGHAFKNGAKKAKTATKKGVNKATNATAKGVKYSAEKIEKGADRVIQKTNCPCKQNSQQVNNNELEQ
ncbi:hypothetical protein IJ541_04590 [bacterium]|nr:hypothetical protein [bacterium]